MLKNSYFHFDSNSFEQWRLIKPSLKVKDMNELVSDIFHPVDFTDPVTYGVSFIQIS